MNRTSTRQIVMYTVAVAIFAVAQVAAASDRHEFTVEFKWKRVAKATVSVSHTIDEQYAVSVTLDSFPANNLPRLLLVLSKSEDLSIAHVRMEGPRADAKLTRVTLESGPNGTEVWGARTYVEKAQS